jgi:hypothetical protein
MLEAEPTRLIEKRPSREMDSDEREETCQESLRACNLRGRRGRGEKRLLAWCEYDREQAERRWVLERHQEGSCYHEPPLRGGG